MFWIIDFKRRRRIRRTALEHRVLRATYRFSAEPVLSENLSIVRERRYTDARSIKQRIHDPLRGVPSSSIQTFFHTGASFETSALDAGVYIRGKRGATSSSAHSNRDTIQTIYFIQRGEKTEAESATLRASTERSSA